MMAENDVERGRAKQDWFLEHGSIQAELLKLKKEALRTRSEEPPEKKVAPETAADVTPPPEERTGSSGQVSPKDLRSVPEQKDGAGPAAWVPEPPKMDRVDDIVKEVSTDDDGGKAARLPVGKIPTAPNLSQKIASVIQLENKLKRRKYEMERAGKAKENAAAEVEDRPEGPPISPKEGAFAESVSEPEAPKVTEGLGPEAGPEPLGGPVTDIACEARPDPPADGATDMELDTGRENKVEGPTDLSTGPEVSSELPAEAPPSVGPDFGGPVQNDETSYSDMPEQNVGTQFFNEPAPAADVTFSEPSVEEHHHGPEASDPSSPRGPRKRSDEGRPVRNDDGREWLQVTRGPERPSKKEQKGSSSPLGKIMSIFRRRQK